MKLKIINDTTDCNKLCELAIVFNGSVGLEKEGLYGSSHLIEHCMCEQVKTIESELLELGLNWNAYTSTNEVCFILGGLEHNVRKMMNKFAMLILNYEIPKEVFERERNVVLTEYNMYASDQEGAMWMNFIRRKYNSYESAGRKKDLEKLTYDKFMAFKNKYFKIPSYVKFTHSSSSAELIDSDLDEVNEFLRGKHENNIPRWNREMKYGNYEDVDIEKNSSFDSQRVLFICKEFSSYETDGNSNFSYSLIFKNLLKNGLTSILMKEIREKLGYVYSISVDVVRTEESKYLFFISTSATSEKIDEVIKKFKTVLSKITTYINNKKYKSAITGMKSAIEMKKCIRFSNVLDEVVLEHEANMLDGKYDDAYKKFINFVASLNLKAADYFLDTDFTK